MVFSVGEVTAIGALGGLVGSLLTHLLANARDDRKARREAYDAFRSTIAPTLAALEIVHPNHAGAEGDMPAYERLRREYSSIRDAYNLLRLKVPGDRNRLDGLWAIFAEIDSTTREPCIGKYKPVTAAHPEEMEMRARVRQRLDAIATPG